MSGKSVYIYYFFSLIFFLTCEKVYKKKVLKRP